MTLQEGEVIEAAARLEFDATEDVVNVYQMQLTSGGPVADADVLNDVVEYLEIAYTLILTLLSVLTTFRDIRVSNVTQQTVLGIVPWDTLSAGDATADALAPGVAGLVSFGTTIPRVSPRKYLGVFTEAHINASGLLGGGWNTQAANYAAQMLGEVVVDGHGYTYGYLSPKTDNFEAAVTALFTNVPAYQRRRKQGRGS